jgi:hypothetical protein
MAVVGEFSLEWNVGNLPLKNYRVEGCCLVPGQNTTGFDTGQIVPDTGAPNPNAGLKCESRFVVNILARGLGDLCLQLKKREFYWPICKIQVFNQPAQGANFNGFGNPLAPGNADCCPADINGTPTEEFPFGPDVPNQNEVEFQTLTDIPHVVWANVPECIDYNVTHLYEDFNFSITVERVFLFEGGMSDGGE